jgi:hypothetical protein
LQSASGYWLTTTLPDGGLDGQVIWEDTTPRTSMHLLASAETVLHETEHAASVHVFEVAVVPSHVYIVYCPEAVWRHEPVLNQSLAALPEHPPVTQLLIWYCARLETRRQRTTDAKMSFIPLRIFFEKSVVIHQ